MAEEPRPLLFTCKSCGSEQPTGVFSTPAHLALVLEADTDIPSPDALDDEFYPGVEIDIINRSPETHRCRAVVDEETGDTCDHIDTYSWSEFHFGGE